MIALPLCKRRCDLVQQGLHQWRQIGLLRGRQVDAWCGLLEKARLEIFGSARHYRLPPLLIRIGESLKAHRPRCAGTAKYQRKNVACRDLEMRRCLLRHPDGQTGKRTVRLSNNHELDAAALKPSRDDHGLTVARMEPVSDPACNRLFAGSMSCVRATA